MVRKVDTYILTTVLIILTIFTATSAATTTTPPASISNLHMISRGIDYIDWGWTDPTTSDFNHVDIYINGEFKVNDPKGTKHYKATSLAPSTAYTIGTHTVDSSGNINPAWKTNIQTTKAVSLGTLRYMTVGDPNIKRDTSDNPYKRLTRAVNYINGRSDVDFTVITGDIVDSATSANFGVAKALLGKLNKPYYIVPGNHDLGSSISKFESYFGPAERLVNTNGYQLIFTSITKDANGTNHWSFDFGRADKSKPTVIFSHGPVQPKPGTTSCVNSWGVYYSYACDMKNDVDSFTKLLGYYAGHVHSGTSQLIGGERYVTADNLGGNGADSDYIGYTKITNGVLSYSTVLY